jgi:enoyl-CoA hydratase/carnithine racemase
VPEKNERVQIHLRDGVADVRLNRPEKMNALDDAMFRGIIDAGLQLKQDKSLRAVVLSGEGRAFCAGLDFSGFAGMAGRGSSDATDDGGRAARGLFSKTNSPANRAQYSAWVWQELPVPVIAAVHGVAYGAGFQIAMGADIRVVAPDARLSVMEIKWGLIPDMAGSQTLKNLVRLDVAKELAFTGRVVSGSEAAQLGLATQLSETPLEAAMQIALEIASKSPEAIRANKRLFNESRELASPEGFKLEEKLQAGLIGSANQVEAVKANLEKRDPKFSDPD